MSSTEFVVLVEQTNTTKDFLVKGSFLVMCVRLELLKFRPSIFLYYSGDSFEVVEQCCTSSVDVSEHFLFFNDLIYPTTSDGEKLIFKVFQENFVHNFSRATLTTGWLK